MCVADVRSIDLEVPSALLHHKTGLFAAQASTKGEAISSAL